MCAGQRQRARGGEPAQVWGARGSRRGLRGRAPRVRHHRGLHGRRRGAVHGACVLCMYVRTYVRACYAPCHARWRASSAVLAAMGFQLPISMAWQRVTCHVPGATPSQYHDWMKMGLHLATPNKKHGAGQGCPARAACLPCTCSVAGASLTRGGACCCTCLRPQHPRPSAPAAGVPLRLAGPLPRYLALKALAHETRRQFMCEVRARALCGAHVRRRTAAQPRAARQPLRGRAPSCKLLTATSCLAPGPQATVGAGLPVISTLRTLLDTGDKVTKIEGILSGTLSYIFNTYRTGGCAHTLISVRPACVRGGCGGQHAACSVACLPGGCVCRPHVCCAVRAVAGMAFSEVVLDAKERGFTEPDPREDLSGVGGGVWLVEGGAAACCTCCWACKLLPHYRPAGATGHCRHGRRAQGYNFGARVWA